MSLRRKFAAVALAIGLGVSLGLATPAFAYAPNAPVLQTNTSTTAPGGGLIVTGSGFCPGCTITLTLYSAPVTLGTTTADPNGNFSTTVTIPTNTAPGNHTIVATDADGDTASTAIVVSAPVSIATSTGLPFTGADIAAMSAVGAVALALGGMLILTGRRRRASQS